MERLLPFSMDLDKIGFIGSIAASLQALREIDVNPADLEQYGLAPPGAVVSVQSSKGEKAAFLLGDLSPGGEGYYIKKSKESFLIL